LFDESFIPLFFVIFKPLMIHRPQALPVIMHRQDNVVAINACV
jgi:hypothetical protein